MSFDKEAFEIKLKASVFKASPTKIAVTSSYFYEKFENLFLNLHYP